MKKIIILLLAAIYLFSTSIAHARPYTSSSLQEIPPGIYEINRDFPGEPNFRVTLTSIEIFDNRQMKINVEWTNITSENLSILCDTNNDDALAFITQSDGSTITPIETYCTNRRGETAPLESGATFQDYAFYGTSTLSQPFSVTWFYDGTIDGITLYTPPPPAPLPDPTTPPATPLDPSISVENITLDPAEPEQFAPVRITLGLTNLGGPVNDPFWGYSGEVRLLDSNGQTLESIPFSKGDSSFINPVIENNRINAEKWTMLITARFGKPTQGSTAQVIVNPTDNRIPGFLVEQPLSVSGSPNDEVCSAVVISRLAGPFLPGANSDLISSMTSFAQSLSCKEKDFACQAPPLAKQFVKELLAIYGNPKNIPVGKVINGVWGLFDTGSLKACGNPVGWIWQLVRELNSQGVRINLLGVHSPATLMVTNQNGQQTGFLLEGELTGLNQIPDANMQEWNGQKYVIFPAQDATVELQGTGDGVMTFDAIINREKSIEDFVFSTIAVTSKSEARLSLADPALAMLYKADGDSVEDVLYPTQLESHPVTEANNNNSSLFFLTITVLLIAGTAGLVLVIRKKSKRI